MLSRTDGIRTGKMPEDTACIAINGRINRSVGYDLVFNEKYKVEVRSRHDFKNGDPYRLTLTRKKMDISDIVIAVHYDSMHEISCALLIKTKSLIPLYLRYLQKCKNQAHLNWNEVMALVNGKDGIDITKKMIAADKILMSKGLYTL